MIIENKKMEVDKYIIERKIDKNIFIKLGDNILTQETINSIRLLTWNRFDLAFKLLFLEFKNKHRKFAESIYYYDIKAQTYGGFKEIDNEGKDSFQKYIDDFERIEVSIKEKGFISEKSLVPLAQDKSILNGAHRVASSIFHKREISVLNTNLPEIQANYENFYKKGVPVNIMDLAIRKFIEYSDNIYIAFLWPSGGNEETEKYFDNVVYKKRIKLSVNGAFNLLVELYKHMDWTGTVEAGYPGIKQKLMECFPNFDSFAVIAFQSDNIEDVKVLKQKVRSVYNIGFSSIHITDTKEEAIGISKLTFSSNGLHFLNYAKPYKYIDLYKQIDKFKQTIENKRINTTDVVIDGSVILCLYGLRKNMDVDFLTTQKCDCLDTDFEPHDSQLKYHAVSKEELIYNDKYFFEFYGLKFISFNQLYSMKKKRNEHKDINDISIMRSLLENEKIKMFFLRLKQRLFYYKIKIKRNSRIRIIEILKGLRLYNTMKSIKKTIKK